MKPPNYNLIAHLVRQSEFSQRVFGPYSRPLRGEGVVKHIRKELVEIEAKPDDLEEWIDVLLLGFDGALACAANKFPHVSPEDVAKLIVKMLDFKQSKNESRVWPDWKDTVPGTAIEHVKSTTESDNV